MRLTGTSVLLIGITLAAGLACRGGPSPRPVLAEDVLLVYLAEGGPAAGLSSAPIPTTGDTVYLHPEPVLTAHDVQRAELTADAFGNPMLELTFTPAGARRLGDVTRENAGRRLAFVSDGVVLLAPRIFAPMTDGVAVIGGGGLGAEIERLAEVLGQR